MKNYPSIPKSVILMNNGKKIECLKELLPEFCDFEKGTAQEFLHFRGIPVDKYGLEPIVIKIEW